MARQIKTGLDYFPTDCNIDDSQKYLIARFGLLGMGVVDTVMRKIYREEGYYTLWDEDVAFLFASEFRIDIEQLNEIISVALDRGIFDRASFEKHRILTSKSIQQRYLEATSRRKNVILKEEYLLIMYTSCQHNDDKSTQSKVKESKVNQTIVKESKGKQADSDAESIPITADNPEKRVYGEHRNVFLTEEELEALKDTLPDWQDRIDHLSEYINYSGRKYKSHYNTILFWAKQDRQKGQNSRNNYSFNNENCSFDPDLFFELACKKTERLRMELEKLPQNEGA